MDGAENVESSEGPAMTNSQQCLSKGLESRNLLFGTEIQPKIEVTEEFRRGEEEAIAEAVQRALDVNITEVAEVQSTEGDILKATEDFHRAGKEIIVNATEDVQRVEEDVMEAIENVRRAEEDIADAPEDAHGAEENMPDAIEDVQRTEEDIAEAIEDVQGAEENISDATEDVQGGEEDHHTKMMSHQGLESRNPSLGTEIQDKMEVSEEFEGGEEEDIPMTNSEQLKQVHQTYRKMECDRRSYHISTEGTMRQQQALLENMKSENCAFKEMVDTYVIKDYQQQMNNLLEQADKLQSMVEIETRRVKDLDNSITELASKEMDAKRATGGCKAAWEKHKSTQIQIQITENRLEKATVDLNIVQGRTKSLQEDMEKLRREQDLYSNVYMKMEKEHSAKEAATEQCIEDIYNAYKETNIYQQQISELLKMFENLHNYYTWLNTNGWAIQDPMPFTQMRFEIPDGSMHKEKDRCSLVGSKGIKIIQENNDEGGMKELSGNKIVKDQHAIASIDYKQWIEMKSLEDIQDVLKIDDVEDILPSFLDACKQDANIYENITHLIQDVMWETKTWNWKIILL